MVGYKSTNDLDNGTHSSIAHRPEMIYAILVLCLLGSSWAQKAEKDPQSLAKDQNTRLAGIYVKDGNENGQLRFLASGLNSGSSSSSSSSGLNSALNQYITNKQDMLEQLRPTASGSSTTGTGTGVTGGTSTVTGSGTGTSTTGTSGVVTTTANGAIYVNLGNTGSSSSSSSSSRFILRNKICLSNSTLLL